MGSTSLRQQELIKRLPANGYNIAKTAREVGYTEQGSRSGTLYASLRKKIEKAYSPEAIKADILKAEKDFTKDKDHSNRARMLELRAKILGLTKDSSQNTQVNVLSPDTLRRFQADMPKRDDNNTQPDTVTPCATEGTSAT